MKANNQTQNPQSNPYKTILSCKLCGKIPFFPEICSDCREMYCQVCITAYLKSNKNICPNPNCKKPYVKHLPQSLTIDLLESLILECKYQDRGCPEMIKYRQYLDHEKDCKYRDAKCEACGTVLQLRQLKEHMETCDKASKNCRECGVNRCRECGNINTNTNTTSPDSMSKSQIAYFQYFEKTITEKIIDCITQQVCKIKIENEKKLEDMYNVVDYLKSEVSRIDRDLKDLRLALHMTKKVDRSKPVLDSEIPPEDFKKERKELSKSFTADDKIGLNRSDFDIEEFEKTAPNDFGSRKPHVQEVPVEVETIGERFNEKSDKFTEKCECKFSENFDDRGGECRFEKIEVFEKGEKLYENKFDNKFEKFEKFETKFEKNFDIYKSDKFQQKDWDIAIALPSIREQLFDLKSEGKMVNDLNSEEPKCIIYLNAKAKDGDSDVHAIVTGHIYGSITVWNYATFSAQLVFKEHTKAVWDLKPLPNLNGVFISASQDETIKLWDIFQLTSFKTIKTECPVYCIESLYDYHKNYVACGGANKHISIWDIQKEQKLLSKEVERRQDLERLLFLKNVKIGDKPGLILTVNYNIIRLYSVANLKKEREFKEHTGWILGLCYVKDDIFATSSQDLTIKLWSAAKEKSIRTISGNTTCFSSLITSPIDDILLVGSKEKSLILFETLKLDSNDYIPKKKNLTFEIDKMVWFIKNGLLVLAIINKNSHKLVHLVSYEMK